MSQTKKKLFVLAPKNSQVDKTTEVSSFQLLFKFKNHNTNERWELEKVLFV
jgi:hypothetical protein